LVFFKSADNQTHTRTHTVTDATDLPVHASATGGVCIGLVAYSVTVKDVET